MKMTFTINHLKSVSLAAAFLFAASVSNAEVERTTVNVTKSPTTDGMQFYMIDMNNDGTDDFSINIAKTTMTIQGATTVSTSVSISGVEDGNVIGMTNTEDDIAEAFSKDDEIGTANWSDNGVLFVDGTTEFQGTPMSIQEGEFLESTGKYLVVRFKIGEDFHLGYIEINTTATSFTVKSYGYEKTAETFITVGAGVTSVSSYLQSNTTIYSTNKTIVANFKNAFNGTMEVINLNGTKVKSMNVSGNSASLSVEEIPSGIYIVVVSGTEGYAAKNVFITGNN